MTTEALMRWTRLPISEQPDLDNSEPVCSAMALALSFAFQTEYGRVVTTKDVMDAIRELPGSVVENLRTEQRLAAGAATLGYNLRVVAVVRDGGQEEASETQTFEMNLPDIFVMRSHGRWYGLKRNSQPIPSRFIDPISHGSIQLNPLQARRLQALLDDGSLEKPRPESGEVPSGRGQLEYLPTDLERYEKLDDDESEWHLTTYDLNNCRADWVKDLKRGVYRSLYAYSLHYYAWAARVDDNEWGKYKLEAASYMGVDRLEYWRRRDILMFLKETKSKAAAAAAAEEELKKKIARPELKLAALKEKLVQSTVTGSSTVVAPSNGKGSKTSKRQKSKGQNKRSSAATPSTREKLGFEGSSPKRALYAAYGHEEDDDDDEEAEVKSEHERERVDHIFRGMGVPAGTTAEPKSKQQVMTEKLTMAQSNEESQRTTIDIAEQVRRLEERVRVLEEDQRTVGRSI